LLQPTASGKRQLVVRSSPSPATAANGGGGGGGNKPPVPSVSIEVWGDGRCLLDLAVPAALHGPIYAGAWFGDGGASWSRDEERVAYVAERPERETTPEWGREDLLFSGGDGGEQRQEPSSKSLLEGSSSGSSGSGSSSGGGGSSGKASAT